MVEKELTRVFFIYKIPSFCSSNFFPHINESHTPIIPNKIAEIFVKVSSIANISTIGMFLP